MSIFSTTELYTKIHINVFLLFNKLFLLNNVGTIINEQMQPVTGFIFSFSAWGLYVELSNSIFSELCFLDIDPYNPQSTNYNRTQRVRLGDTLSNVASILCGVPQGSILGPLLFLIYINDITYCSNKLLMYLFADDTTVFITASNYYNLIDEMNEELQKLTDWFCANLLSLNIKKTNYMIFSGPNKKIESNLNHNIIINNKPIDRV